MVPILYLAFFSLSRSIHREMNVVYLVWMNSLVFYTWCFHSCIKRLRITDRFELVFMRYDAKWFMHLYGRNPILTTQIFFKFLNFWLFTCTFMSGLCAPFQ